MHNTPKHFIISVCTLILLGTYSNASLAQDALTRKLSDASAALSQFVTDGTMSTDALDGAFGIAVIPNVLRGGFLLGARRGKGVLVVRDANGGWRNPAFIQLTGGSIGWQIGVESADIVLVFANETSIRNIENGRFTLSGDATAIAGPSDARSTAAVLFKSEVYAYIRAKGLFAGASLEGTRLGIDEKANIRLYGTSGSVALATQTNETPSAARRFLLSLETLATIEPPAPVAGHPDDHDAAQTFPLNTDSEN